MKKPLILAAVGAMLLAGCADKNPSFYDGGIVPFVGALNQKDVPIRNCPLSQCSVKVTGAKDDKFMFVGVNGDYYETNDGGFIEKQFVELVKKTNMKEAMGSNAEISELKAQILQSSGDLAKAHQNQALLIHSRAVGNSSLPLQSKAKYARVLVMPLLTGDNYVDYTHVWVEVQKAQFALSKSLNKPKSKFSIHKLQ